MTRGKHRLKAISRAIAPEQYTKTAATERPAKLYAEKVRLVAARYYYYTTLSKNYEEILRMLEQEFFISSGRITDIIEQQIPALKVLRKQAPDKQWFRKQWGHLKW